MNYTKEPFRTFSFPLSLSLSHPHSSPSFIVHETINTTMIVFGAAAFTRPPEQEVVQVPEEKRS
jgi:hypothetical protein